MGYISSSFGQSNQWNTEGGPNDTVLSVIQIASTSTSNRLDLYAQDGAERWDVIAYGKFLLTGNPTTVAGLTDAQVTSLETRLNGNPFESVEYTTGFDLIRWLTSYDYRYTLLGGDDTFTGSLQNPIYGDEVRGGAGNDQFTGYKDGIDTDGSINYDSFFGEAGIDTAIYRGALSEYRLNTNAQIWDGRYEMLTSGTSIVDSVAGRDGTDWLKEVERLEFADANLALDTAKGEIAGSAYRIYKAAFDRAPDAGGLGFWIDSMDDGASLLSVAGGFINSAEFQSVYGANVSDRDYVTRLYNNVLDRNPDQGGYDYWLGALTRGASREDILVSFSESAENIANVAGLITSGIQYQEWIS